MARTKLETPNFKLGKRKDGYYEIRYTEHGKSRAKTTGTKCPKEAEAARARFAHAYKAPKIGPRPTVEEISDAYLLTREGHVRWLKPLTYNFAAIKAHIGALHADTITQSVINGYISSRRSEKSLRGGAVSEATISKELRMLRAALNWAYAEHRLDRAPGFKIELSSGNVRERWITKEEAIRLTANAEPHVALFIRIALGTAKRREAILSLKWDNVRIALPGHEYLDFGDGIGNKRRGATYISGNAPLITALKAAKETAVTGYVIEFRGKSVKDIKRGLATACEKAGIDPIGTHTLKHTAITWMVQAGRTFEDISKFANTSVRTIEKHYAHHAPGFADGFSAAVAF